MKVFATQKLVSKMNPLRNKLKKPKNLPSQCSKFSCSYSAYWAVFKFKNEYWNFGHCTVYKRENQPLHTVHFCEWHPTPPIRFPTLIRSFMLNTICWIHNCTKKTRSKTENQLSLSTFNPNRFLSQSYYSVHENKLNTFYKNYIKKHTKINKM